MIKPMHEGGDDIDTRSLARPEETGGRFERFRTRLHVLVHCRGRFQTAIVRDLSLGGFRLDRTFGLMPSDRIVIELVSGRNIAGKIAWSVGRGVGVALEQALLLDDPLLQKAMRAAPQAAA